MRNIPSLITRIIEIQHRDTLTNFQMAEKLCCSTQLYRDTKSGRLPIGLTILKGAVKAFPEVTLDALIFLTDGADISTHLAGISTDDHQKSPNRNLGGFWCRLMVSIRRRIYRRGNSVDLSGAN